MIQSFQPTQWINAVCNLSNNRNKIYINLEGCFAIFTAPTYGWRELRVDEIVKTSLKVLKKNSSSFKYNDLISWKETFKQLKNRPTHLSDEQNQKIRELSNWLDRLIEHQASAVSYLDLFQKNNAQQKEMERTAAVAALNDDFLILMNEYQSKGEELYQATTIPVTHKQAKKIEQRLKELSTSICKHENIFIESILKKQVIDCSSKDPCLVVHKQLQGMQTELIFLKVVLIQSTRDLIKIHNFIDLAEQHLSKLIGSVENLVAHVKIFNEIIMLFEKISDYKKFLSYYGHVLPNFMSKHINLKKQTDHSVLELKPEIVTSVSKIENLACLTNQALLLNSMPISSHFEKIKDSVDDGVNQFIVKLEKLFSTELNNEDEINKLKQEFECLKILKHLLATEYVADDQSILDKIKEAINEVNKYLNPELHINFNSVVGD